MTSALLENPKITHARKTTEEASREVDRWAEQRESLCDDTDRILGLATTLVANWMDVARFIDGESQSGAIDDYMGVGDYIFPYVVVSNELLQEVELLRKRMNVYECELENHSDFQIAVFEMGKVTHFFENWPRSRSEHVSQVREQFARGESRAFQDFLNEMCSRTDSAR